MALEREARLSFRNRLREDRARAFANAEDFLGIVQTLEELGQVLTHEHGNGFGHYVRALQAFVAESVFTHDHNSKFPGLRIERLLLVVREGRNDAVHIGSFARKVVNYAIDLALIVEETLVPDGTVSDFMIRNAVTAEYWQPLSFIRRQMLEHSFSYLPVYSENDGWQLISDSRLARYLRSGPRRTRLAQTLLEASSGLAGALELDPSDSYAPETNIDSILKNLSSRPILVLRPEEKGCLLGIITAFDLL